jgi:NADPH:quinone reductase-like Zn-dependent oxidoreductase
LLARRQSVPAILLVRSTLACENLVRHGVKHVVVTTTEGFEGELGALAAKLGTTAVFNGVGGGVLSRILPSVPMNSAVYVYGFLGGATPISLPTMLLVGKKLTLRRPANLESATVRDPQRLAAATNDIESVIDDPLFRTGIGKEFTFDQIDRAVTYESMSGSRASSGFLIGAREHIAHPERTLSSVRKRRLTPARDG